MVPSMDRLWKTCYLLCRAQVLTCGVIYVTIVSSTYKKKKKILNIPLSLINYADSNLETQQSAIRLCILAFSNLVLPVHSQMFENVSCNRAVLHINKEL